MGINKHSKYLDIFSKDPLSSSTYQNRKYLLFISLATIAIYKAGFLPKKISWADIELSKSNLESLKFFLFIILTYFLISFFISSIFEIITWLKEIFIEHKNYDEQNKTPEQILEHLRIQKEIKKAKKTDRLFLTLVCIRISFEYIIPLIIGTYSVFCI